jgi:hypothetical protein
MDHKQLQIAYVEKINTLLPTVDFDRLDKACNSNGDEYAKEILKQMHDLFVEIYGTDNLDFEEEFAQLPAVIQGRKTGHVGLGLVALDLLSSGELCGTFFFTPRGVIHHSFEKMKPEDFKYISTMYRPYDYWYTVSIGCDCHVEFDDLPKKVAELLNSCCPDQREQEPLPDIPGQGVEMR